MSSNMAATQFYAIFGYGDRWNYVFPHATEDTYITLQDPDSITQTYSAVTAWDYNENGEPVLTELGWKCYNDQTTEMPAELGGGTFYEGMNKGNIVRTINQAVFSTEEPLQMDMMLQQKASQVGSVLTEYNWKMVLAADEAEFNALKDEMIKKAKGLGYDDVVAFGILQTEQMFRARKQMNESLGE